MAMRSIAVKLTLAFLLVGLIGVLLVAVLLGQSTRSAFNQFILRREEQALVASLVEYYRVNGSWEGVTEALQVAIARQPELPARQADRSPDWERFILLGPDREVLYSYESDQIGTQMASRDMKRAVQLELNGGAIGWLLLAPNTRGYTINSPEWTFLRNINRAALLSGVAAAAIAVGLGIFLTYSLIRGLRELREATDDIARGNLGRQVPVRTNDELGDLAASFNKMSHDLAQAVQARRQMTADIAHDLRTPLSVISGYTEALSDGKLTGSADIFSILYRETGHLSRLVDDLRTLSLADAGELAINKLASEPCQLLEQMVVRHSLAAEQLGIAVKVECPAGASAIQVDPERMAQVFDNLVSNALRFTPAGGEVTLAYRTVEGQPEFQVRDTGPGIPPEDLERVFDRFYRVDPSRAGSEESGLGLAIARSIVELHGGTIHAESTPGQGAVFVIRLPAAG